MTQELLERLDNPPYQYMRFIPYPETPLYKYCIENELITSPHELGDWAPYTTRMANGTNLSHIPKQLIDDAMRHFIQTYATRSLRFTIKHNPASFFQINAQRNADVQNPLFAYPAMPLQP